MSTFYLLPSRPQLGERFASFLNTLFPGLDWSSVRWADLADALGSAAIQDPDVYVVFREELPEGEDPATALTDGFGAVSGDEVVEVKPGSAPVRWRLGGAG